MTNLIDDVIN